MFDLRYHVASLAAVFFALVIGILVGVALASHGLGNAERRKLQDDLARARSQIDQLKGAVQEDTADTKFVAKRQEARAQKLEDQVRGMTAEIIEWRGRAEVSENSVMMLGEQLTQTTRERDALRIDVGFFQKQIGALQRAAAQEKLKPKK